MIKHCLVFSAMLVNAMGCSFFYNDVVEILKMITGKNTHLVDVIDVSK